jgi:response regulator RpfG family c-di-GMP phosphodiesterase
MRQVFTDNKQDRPYRNAWPEEKVREHTWAGSGSHFNPQVVEKFLQLDLLMSKKDQ